MYMEIKNITKNFTGTHKETLQDISFTIEEGEFVCILGPSGCGKSTLLNIIAGLERPSSGSVEIMGKAVMRPGADRAVMFQEAALFPWLTVWENVSFGMRMAGVVKEVCAEKTRYYLKMVKLWDFRDYYPHEISGGMKQRTALARALASDAKILLMDEPFSALDKQTINMLRNELEQIWEETGKTIFFVTHSVEEAVYFADKIVILSDNPGRIKEVYNVSLERPRYIEAEAFIRIRKSILEKVRKEVEKFAQEEHDKK